MKPEIKEDITKCNLTQPRMLFTEIITSFKWEGPIVDDLVPIPGWLLAAMQEQFLEAGHGTNMTQVMDIWLSLAYQGSNETIITK